MSNRLAIRDPWVIDMHNRRNDFLGPLTQQFDKFFDEFFKPSSLNSLKASASFPKLNISEEGNELIVRAAMPGMAAKDIKIELLSEGETPVLKISGQMSESYSSPDDASYYIKELKQSYFSREITLPEYVKQDPITSSLKDGILTLKWQKPNPSVKQITKEIKIEEE